jgi:hypothetical protein
VRPKRVLQSGRVLDESRYIDDLARKKAIQELILNKENGIFTLGQIFRQRGLSCRHFAAQENQLRWDSHVVTPMVHLALTDGAEDE